MSLRPKTFKDILGQDKVKESLQISIKSAKKRSEALGHVLIDSQPGFGKTTLSLAIANELGVPVKTVLGGNIKSFKDILPTITNMKEGEVLFIDEIHRVNKRIAESLYTVLEDFRVDMPFEADNGDMEIITIDLPTFTIVGATTELGSLVSPFRDRFKLKFSLETYSKDTLFQILKINSKKLQLNINEQALDILATASRGTPRIANSLLEWIRDYSVAKDIGKVTKENTKAALDMRDIGLDGSTENDRRYLNFLKSQKGTVGVSTISSSINIDRETIESVIEPFLLSHNKISKTPRGRIAL